MKDEPKITINGTELSAAEAMTLRVAVTNFMQDLKDPEGRVSDRHGRHMTLSYKANSATIMLLMTRDKS